MSNSKKQPFWQAKKLHKMTQKEWESLCDGCGKCCLNKLEDWDTGEVYYTNIACNLLNCETCQCSDYENRLEKVPDCIDLSPKKVDELQWLPPTCAYRLVSEGKDLPNWHHLKTGDRESIHKAGYSVKGSVFSEGDMQPEEYEKHIVTWPSEEK